MLHIVAVSYNNTIPFVYGIENSGFLNDYTLTLVPPSECAQFFADGKADIALVPVGLLHVLNDYKIITPFCLSALNEVKSVMLLSNRELKNISCIGLDNESATSVKLVRILARYYWKINPEYKTIRAKEISDNNDCDAFVVIGDKSFDISNAFTYKIDLAAAWNEFTGLPFVFALWICRKDTDALVISKFESALEYGVKNISKAIQHYMKNYNHGIDLEKYLKENIDYTFDDLKQQSLLKFLNFAQSIDRGIE